MRRILVLVAWLASLAAAFTAGVYTYQNRAIIKRWLGSVDDGQVIETSLYNLVVEKLEIPAYGRDGAIDALGDGVLFVNRLGAAWFVDHDRALHALTLRVPVNFDEFEADPANADVIQRDRFAVKDILVQGVSGGIRLLASHSYWFADRECYGLRVSSLETTKEALLDPTAVINEGWRTVFDSTPCRAMLPSPRGKSRSPTLGAGGRLVALSESQILLSIGGFGFETMGDESVAPPVGDRSYNSTILIDLSTHEARDYTKGHRNPQGLAVASDGTIWLTDHGARGGDELNRILEGRDYGHPVVTYGTDYNSMIWRRNPRQGRHDGFEKPVYAWIPSIGVSQLVVIKRPLFSNWQDDLLVSSLKAQSLFRVRVEDERAIFAEPISIGHRIRDIAEMADGTLVLKTDDGILMYMRPIDVETLYSLDLTSAARGEVLATACAGCHSSSPDGPDGIGPNLWGVVGRRIAAREGFEYSPALRGLKGNWTPEELGRFIANPEDVAPGTTMVLTTAYGKREIVDLVAYLSRLR